MFALAAGCLIRLVHCSQAMNRPSALARNYITVQRRPIETDNCKAQSQKIAFGTLALMGLPRRQVQLQADPCCGVVAVPCEAVFSVIRGAYAILRGACPIERHHMHWPAENDGKERALWAACFGAANLVLAGLTTRMRDVPRG
jgi:hypothetical protein